ncbi:lysylphosphatidylglycerol synthase transmembrane domain-containing protein [Aminobacter sp. UC22_36]|uniref:lysylphosphatidylglycerol synthase transmembrane domain-containing protein n=1 Tax=Aminobacter sp. UC22_36 TaxID=3374549 RepID=UPI0037568352
MVDAFRRLWLVVIAVLAVAFTFYQFDLPALAKVLPTIPFGFLLLLMSVVTLSVFAVCCVRWIAISQLPWSLSVFARVYCYISFVIGASIVTPFQLGELLKIKFAHQSGLKLGKSAVNIALERILDLATIAALGAAGFIHLHTGSVPLSIGAVVALIAAGLMAPMMLQAYVGRLGETPWGARMRALVGESLPIGRLAIVGLATILKWGLTLVAWVLIVRTVYVDFSIWQGAFLVGAVTMISILSMVPGGVGVQELSVRAILVGMGAEPSQAEAAAIILRLFTPVMVFLGLAHLPFLYRKSDPTGGKEPHG